MAITLFQAAPKTRRVLFGVMIGSTIGFCFTLLTFPVAAGVFLTLMLTSGGLWIHTQPERGCSFCHRPKEDVRWLLPGDVASICDECLSWSLSDLHQRAPGEFAIHILRSIPPHLPRSASNMLFRTEQNNSVERDELVAAALRVEDDETVVAVIERVPPEKRTVHDWVHLSTAYEELGRYDDALAAISHYIDNEFDRPWGLNNRASTLLARGRLDRHMIVDLIGDVNRATELWAAMLPPRLDLVAQGQVTLAEARRQLGDLGSARELLDFAEDFTRVRPSRLVIEARIAADRGLRSEVQRLLDLALAMHHPESTRRQRTLALKQKLLGLVSS